MPSSQNNKDKKKAMLSSKIAGMAAAETAGKLSAITLTVELGKQHKLLKEDMITLIQASLTPIQSAIAGFHKTVYMLGRHRKIPFHFVRL